MTTSSRHILNSMLVHKTIMRYLTTKRIYQINVSCWVGGTWNSSTGRSLYVVGAAKQTWTMKDAMRWSCSKKTIEMKTISTVTSSAENWNWKKKLGFKGKFREITWWYWRPWAFFKYLFEFKTYGDQAFPVCTSIKELVHASISVCC